jgi:hypothetical protein
LVRTFFMIMVGAVPKGMPSRPGEFHPEHRVARGGRPPPVVSRNSIDTP